MSQISIEIHSSSGKITELKVYKNETILEGKRKYEMITKSKLSDTTWKWSNHILKNKKTFDYYEIEDGAIIYSNQKNYGGGPTSFTDVSKKHTINIGFSSDAPDYRTVGKGINIFGICKTGNCVTKGDEVIVPIKKEKLDFIKENFNFRCPECKGIIEPKTVGFYMCQYHIYGTKIGDNKIVNFDNDFGESHDRENLQYFDEASNGKALFISLIFEISKYYD